MAAAPGPGRKPKEDLQKLIADIGEWLKGGDGTSLDGGSSGGGGGGGKEPHVIERFRLVLPRVLDTVLDPTRGAERGDTPSAAVFAHPPTPAVRRVAGKELKPVLGIVTAVIQKHPEVLNHGSGDLPRHLFARMFTLLTLSIRCVLPPLPCICLALASCWSARRAARQGAARGACCGVRPELTRCQLCPVCRLALQLRGRGRGARHPAGGDDPGGCRQAGTLLLRVRRGGGAV